MRALLHPAGEGRGIPVADRSLEDGVCEPVDLQEHHTRRLVAAAGVLVLPQEMPDHDVVVLEGKDGVEHHAEERQSERDGERPPEAVDRDPGDDPRNDQHRGAVEEQRCEAKGQDCEWEREAHEQGPYQRVEQAEDGCRTQSRPEVREVEAWEQPRQEDEQEGRRDPEDEHSPDGAQTGSSC